VRTVAVAALVAAAVVAGGWTLQALGLPPAARGDVAASSAARWLSRYRLASSSLRLDGRTVRGQCFHGWFDGRGGHDERGTLLVLGDGAAVRDVPRRPLDSIRLGELSALNALELAGCTDVLGPRLASYAVANTIRLRSVHFDGRPALALRLRRLTLFISPRTDKPLGAELAGVRSSIRLTQVTRADARTLEGGT
jgi:hypothetical protein